MPYEVGKKNNNVYEKTIIYLNCVCMCFFCFM